MTAAIAFNAKCELKASGGARVKTLVMLLVGASALFSCAVAGSGGGGGTMACKPSASPWVPQITDLEGRFLLKLTVLHGVHRGQEITSVMELWSTASHEGGLIGRSTLSRYAFRGVRLDRDPAAEDEAEPGVSLLPWSKGLAVVIGSSGFMDDVGVILYPDSADRGQVSGSWHLVWWDSTSGKQKGSSGSFCAVREGH